MLTACTNAAAARAHADRAGDDDPVSEDRYRAGLADQVPLLRDITGNPFRPRDFDPSWQTTTAVDVARIIYDDRRFDLVPVLADALEDAGCDAAALLTHLRGDGPHVRGCWAVDLVLGRV